MSISAIEWTMLVWNAIVGCTRVSAGCLHCYAERMAWRHVLMCRALGRPCRYDGTVHLVGGEPSWTGKLNFDEASLDLPLRRKKPATWFVNSMSDFFHENVRDEWIDRMFNVMAWCPQHTFQVLTKRPERMRAYCATMAALGPQGRAERIVRSMYRGHPAERLVAQARAPQAGAFAWPLPNVHLGVSVEDQATADERIPLLLQTPAAVRWVSYEPALGMVSFRPFLSTQSRFVRDIFDDVIWDQIHGYLGSLDWIVVGGESGYKGRPFDFDWARSAIAQCSAAGVPVFFKQAGVFPVDRATNIGQWAGGRGAVIGDDLFLKLRDKKGGDLAEIPEEFHVRHLPAGPTA